MFRKVNERNKTVHEFIDDFKKLRILKKSLHNRNETL